MATRLAEGTIDDRLKDYEWRLTQAMNGIETEDDVDLTQVLLDLVTVARDLRAGIRSI